MWKRLTLSELPSLGLTVAMQPHPFTFFQVLPRQKVRFLLARKSGGRLPIGYTWGPAGLECPEPPEVRVQRLKVCQGMEKEQMTPFDLYQ